MPTVDFVTGGYGTPTDGVSDCGPAYGTFRTWARTQNPSQVILTVPYGASTGNTFYFNITDPETGSAWELARGINNLIIQGTGAGRPIFSNGISLGTSAIKSGNAAFGTGVTNWTARLATVSAGATSLQCLTIADAALFAPGGTPDTIACITGVDMIGRGDPPDPQIMEFVTISSVDTGNGIIHLAAPLQYSYKETWPCYYEGDLGFHPDCGGPATLYAMYQPWNCTVEYQNMSFDKGAAITSTNSRAWSMTLRNCHLTTLSAVIPTVNQYWNLIDSDFASSGSSIEMDKFAVNITIDNSSMQTCHCQNPYANNLLEIRNNSIIHILNGGPRYLTIDDSTVGSEDATLGPTSYGVSIGLIARNSVLNGQLRMNAASVVYPYPSKITFPTGSTISVIKPIGGEEAPTWAAPESYACIGALSTYDAVVKVLDLSPGDASIPPSSTTIDILAPFGLPNTIGLGANITMLAHGCPNLQMLNCEIPIWDSTITYSATEEVRGSDGNYYYSQIGSNVGNNPISTSPTDWIKFSPSTLPVPHNIASKCQPGAQGKFFGQYSKRYYTGTMIYTGGGVASSPWDTFVVGRLVSIKVEVTQADTGGTSPTYTILSAFGNPNILKSDTTGYLTSYFPTIDLTKTGVRTITPTSVSFITGDTNFGSPPGDIWFAGTQSGAISARVDGHAEGTWPIWYVEIITDMGFDEETVSAGATRTLSYGAAKYTSRPVKIPHV